MKYMDLAVKIAKKAQKKGNVPVGCVIVNNNKIISYSSNKKNSSGVSVYHAEIIAIIKACKKLKRWQLDDCEMYVTLKPCAMCTAAIAESRIKKVYYILESNYIDNLESNVSNIEYVKFSDEEKYNDVISNFFKRLRK